jgi:hypothetical protein
MTTEQKPTPQRQDQRHLVPQEHIVLPQDLVATQALSVVDLPLARIEPQMPCKNWLLPFNSMASSPDCASVLTQRSKAPSS